MMGGILASFRSAGRSAEGAFDAILMANHLTATIAAIALTIIR